MSKKNATILWNAIVAYAGAMWESGNEGNSGEFSDDKEAAKIAKALEEAEKNVIEIFAKRTGWMPVRLSSTEINWKYQKGWQLEKVNNLGR